MPQSPKKRASKETKKLEGVLKSLPKTRKSKSRKLKGEIKKSKKRETRGSPTRGWSSASPQKGEERQALFQLCGKKCFLMPRSLGYPVCEAIRVSGKKSACKINCTGVLAAKVRAGQFHRPSLLLAAQKLEKRFCNKKIGKSPTRKSPTRKSPTRKSPKRLF